MIQFIKKELQVLPKDIHCYGWSLGGGIAANVCALHPECTGNIVLERTFSSTAKVPLALMNKFFQALFSWIPRMIRHHNWEIDTASAVNKLKGRLFVIYHPNDPLIHPSASLYQTLVNGRTSLEHALVLPPGQKAGLDHHVRPLREYTILQDGHEKSAEQLIGNFFILPKEKGA